MGLSKVKSSAPSGATDPPMPSVLPAPLPLPELPLRPRRLRAPRKPAPITLPVKVLSSKTTPQGSAVGQTGVRKAPSKMKPWPPLSLKVELVTVGGAAPITRTPSLAECSTVR